MNLKYVLFVWLLVPCAQAQTEEKVSARLSEAIRAGQQTTAKQCAADLESWGLKDEKDEKANTDWVQKLSTEELSRLRAEAMSCPKKMRKNHPQMAAEMHIWVGRFYIYLVHRAELILKNHGLMQEYVESKD
jgi:hypothetical protein